MLIKNEYTKELNPEFYEKIKQLIDCLDEIILTCPLLPYHSLVGSPG